MSLQTSDSDLKAAQDAPLIAAAAATAVAAAFTALSSPVLPVANFISNINAFINWFGSCNLSGLGLTSVDAGLIANIVAQQYENGGSPGVPSVDLSGNALTSVDAILSGLNGQGMSGGTLNLSGGSNAAPTPAQVHQNAIDQFQFPGGGSGGSFDYSSSGSSGGSWFFSTQLDNTIPISSSSVDTIQGGTVRIGVQDSPSGAAIAAMWVSLSGLGSATGDTVTVETDDDSLLPTSQDSAGSIIYTPVQGGQSFMPNSDLTNLVSVLGWSITTN